MLLILPATVSKIGLIADAELHKNMRKTGQILGDYASTQHERDGTCSFTKITSFRQGISPKLI